MTLSPRIARRAIAAAALGCTTALVAACGSASPSAGPAPHTATAHPATTGQHHTAAPATGSTPATGPAGSTGAQTGSQTGTTTTASGVPACTTQNLRMDLFPFQGSPAVTNEYVEFLNHGSQPCTLYGYPGVSFVTAKGQLLGEPATELPSPPRTLQTVKPGESVYAVLQIESLAQFNQAECSPADSFAVRVYPPNQATPILFPLPMQVCSGPVHQLTVETVQSPAS